MSLYDVSQVSEIGAREKQEDAVFFDVSEKEMFATLCDGMGGMDGGSEASRMSVDILKEYYSRFRTDDHPSQWMLQAVVEADDRVYDIRDGQGRRIGAGTTLLGVYLIGNKLYWVSVGDSRIYILRGNSMIKVTSDHVWLNTIKQQLQDGNITQEEFEKEKATGDSLVSYIGIGGLPLIDVNKDAFQLQQGDVIILCSDGLYKNVSDAEIADMIRQGVDANQKAELLSRSVIAKRNPKQDNYSFIVIKLEGAEG